MTDDINTELKIITKSSAISKGTTTVRILADVTVNRERKYINIEAPICVPCNLNIVFGH